MSAPIAFLATFLMVLFALLLCLFIHFKLVSSRYWSKRNIPSLEPVFLLGNMWKGGIFENLMDILKKWHLKHKQKKILGFWVFTQPNLLIMDLDITKRILIKDFNNFRDRGIEVDTDRDPLASHLFLIHGKKWRNLRVKLTPTFTSGKMKMMFPMIVKVGKELQNVLRKAASGKETVEMKSWMARYTTDVISSCAFGIETNSLHNPNSEFLKYGKKSFAPSLRNGVLSIVLSYFPALIDLLRIRFFPKDVADFFMKAVKETADFREKNNVRRNDFFQLIIQLMRSGKLDDPDKSPSEEFKDDEDDSKFTIPEATAQCFVFFLGGFETSATALGFAFYELALNPEIQIKLQKEIDDTLEKHNNEMTYEGLCGMEYLDMVVQETLRKYPPVGNLQRKCTNDYVLPELGVTIDKGTIVTFSVDGIHYDPDIYPQPEKFRPERFSPEEKSRRDPMTFLPFGEGPRNCIGSRFGLLQIKIGLIALLQEYSLEVCKTTPIPFVKDARGFIPVPVGGVPLKIVERTKEK